MSLLAIVATTLFFAAALTVAAQNEQVLKVGKKGDVSFDAETKVGDLTLKPGRYFVQHRVVGSDHFVHFTEVTKEHPYARSGGGMPKAHPGEVKCRLEPLTAKASETAVYWTKEDGAVRVTKIVIRGENVAHEF
jgi:hypothetical protein